MNPPYKQLDRLSKFGFPLSRLVLAGVIVCALFICGWLALQFFQPLSAVPEPYPGAVVTTNEHGVGNWGSMREQTYLINRSLAEMEQYYQEQMPRYCGIPVKFASQTEMRDAWPCLESGASCYIASCKIPTLWSSDLLHGQYFDVQLYVIDGNTTKVIQITSWTE